MSEKTLKLIKDNDVKWVDLRFTDTKGKQQHVTFPADKVNANFFKGQMFDGSSIAGWKGINESDMVLLPDDSTAVLDPFAEEPQLNLVCSILEPSTMSGYDRDPRSIAARAEAYLKSTGIGDTSYMGPEPEFFIFDDVKYRTTMGYCMSQIISQEAAWSTDKDKEDIRLGLEVGVDYVALSFVREPQDIELLRAFLKQHPSAHQPQIVAKIEHQFAVNHFDAIARAADVIMVARGDLGIECNYEELPIIQRRIVKTCQQLGRPVIVATHMLESMIQSPTPTRAEITDVANAVFEQSDAIMLSGETTVGKHPLGCIEVMDTIARRIERSGGTNYQEKAELTSSRQKLVRSAVGLADDIKANAMLVFTKRGHMARFASWMRPRHSAVYAFTDRWPTADGLTLLRGVIPRVVAFNSQDPDRTVDAAVTQLMNDGLLRRGDTVVVITNMASGERIVDGVKIRTLD